MKKYVKSADDVFYQDPKGRADIAVATDNIDVLYMLMFDPDKRVRGAVALNQYAPQDILVELAKDPSKYVRECVACRIDDPAIIYELSKDPDAFVRQQLAQNPNVPSYVLSGLAKDWDVGVRMFVASNMNTPKGILETLAESEDYDVSGAAKNTLLLLKGPDRFRF